MPLYDYHCEPCNKTREVRHSITESPEIQCEDCHEPMFRLLGGVPVQLDQSFPGERQKVVDARLRRQEQRLKHMVKGGKLTDEDVEKMAEIRDKYAEDSPYVTDPTKDGKQDPNPEDPSTGHFDDQLEM